MICTKTYQGIFASTHSMKDEAKAKEAFNLLMGRFPVGEPKISVTAVRNENFAFSAMVLHIQDNQEKKDFVIDFYSNEMAPLATSPLVFHVVGGYDSFSRPTMLFGEVKSIKGQVLNVMMKYNYIEDTCDNSFIRIHILKGRKKIDLFRLPVETSIRCSSN